MHDDPVVTNLATRARDADQQAWDALAERHAPLIWSICRRHHLDGADAEDLAQTVWPRLLASSIRSATRPRSPAG